jgi:outer membrane protein OmpA-like peptidoglycan-associated protein
MTTMTTRSIPVLSTFLAFLMTFGLVGCGGSTPEGAGQGAAIGAAAGTIAGGLEAESILAGGAVGAAAGIAADEYLDDEESELEETIDSWVERVRENAITVNFWEGEIFEGASDELTAMGERELSELADIVGRYDATAVVVRAWSDREATARNRAERVENYLMDQGVEAGRLASVGLTGERPGMVSVLLMARP